MAAKTWNDPRYSVILSRSSLTVVNGDEWESCMVLQEESSALQVAEAAQDADQVRGGVLRVPRPGVQAHHKALADQLGGAAGTQPRAGQPPVEWRHDHRLLQISHVTGHHMPTPTLPFDACANSKTTCCRTAAQFCYAYCELHVRNCDGLITPAQRATPQACCLA